MREFFNDRNVRIALSLAVDRDELNELIYDGLLTPRQYSPLAMSPNYYAKLANAYIEYDPDKANRLLDEAGYTEKDADGFRLWKDGSGETLSFVIEGTGTARQRRRGRDPVDRQVLSRRGHQGHLPVLRALALHRALSGQRDRGRLLGRRPHRAAAGARAHRSSAAP